MPFKQSNSQIATGITKKAFASLGKNKSLLERVGTREAQQAYYTFGKPPIDSRESIGQTKMKFFGFAKSAFLRFSIDTKYANFFRFGLGTNVSYGRRDPLPIAGLETVKYIKQKLGK